MRLIDLHCNWALQYAAETCQYDAVAYADVRDRLHQIDRYLTGTAIAVLACGRRAGDWSRQADVWKSLGEMIARHEAEFSGRLLIGPEDLQRWSAEPKDAICWGVLGVAGFDALVRQPADLDKLPDLFERGVRVFQPVETEASLMGGASVSGDDRGLTELGLAFLDRLDGLSQSQGAHGTRAVIDLANLNDRTTGAVLSWFENTPSRSERLLLLRSNGTVGTLGRPVLTGLQAENLRRMRALGGVIGLSPGQPYFHTPEEFRGAIEAIAAIPFRGELGTIGIGIGTDFLNLERSLPELENVSRITDWLTATFGADDATRLIRGNALDLLRRTTGTA